MANWPTPKAGIDLLGTGYWGFRFALDDDFLSVETGGKTMLKVAARAIFFEGTQVIGSSHTASFFFRFHASFDEKLRSWFVHEWNITPCDGETGLPIVPFSWPIGCSEPRLFLSPAAWDDGCTRPMKTWFAILWQLTCSNSSIYGYQRYIDTLHLWNVAGWEVSSYIIINLLPGHLLRMERIARHF